MEDVSEGAESEVLYVTNEDAASPLDVPTLTQPEPKSDGEPMKQPHRMIGPTVKTSHDQVASL